MITLLLPGFDGTGRQFDPLLRELPPGLGAVAVSYPADQPLDYDELVELAAKMIPTSGPWALLAESFSGPVAAMLAARHPERLIGLVLVASFVECPVRGVSRLGLLAKPVVMLRRIAPLFLLRYFLAGNDAPALFVAASREWIAPVSSKVLVNRLHAVLSVDAREALRSVAAPILILSGSRDRLVNHSAIRRLLAVVPGARHVAIDSPHMMLQRRPVECAAEIARFISDQNL